MLLAKTLFPKPVYPGRGWPNSTYSFPSFSTTFDSLHLLSLPLTILWKPSLLLKVNWSISLPVVVMFGCIRCELPLWQRFWYLVLPRYWQLFFEIFRREGRSWQWWWWHIYLWVGSLVPWCSYWSWRRVWFCRRCCRRDFLVWWRGRILRILVFFRWATGCLGVGTRRRPWWVCVCMNVGLPCVSGHDIA